MKTPTILVVEDDPGIRELYASALRAAELNVVTAANGKEGVDLALEHHPEVILMDIVMPEMNGHNAVTAIRKDPWGKNAKVIYLTNMTDAENVVHAVERKSDEYIIKAHADVKEVVNLVRMTMYS